MRAYRLQSLLHQRLRLTLASPNGRELSSAAKTKPAAVVGKYSSTVILPQTSFDLRANSRKTEPALQKWWQDNQIYENLSANNPGEKFVLHDGPPYANGDLHMGHALNKILKDFINKYQILRGRKVCYVPGWDCHGLPIELKVLQNMNHSEREKLTPLLLREKAARFAASTVETQMKSFRRFGVWGDWAKPYLTMHPEYEAAQISVFGQMVMRGHIYRGKKPVHWSPSTRTALAEAELEYPDNHVSRSIYVAFPATKLSPLLEKLAGGDHNVRVAVWTTTPWTIPANLAVAVNADLEYCLVSHMQVLGGAKLLVARDLAARVMGKLGVPEGFTVSDSLLGSDLLGTQYRHPLYSRTSDVLIGGDYITTESGTGLVHTAPGHGQEDYQTGLRHGLPLLSPVDDAGLFTAEAGEKFVGLSVLGEGNAAVITALAESGSLLTEECYAHKYPYDWRSKKPTIFRATEQWFASVSSFRDDALRAIDATQWVPAVGRNRIVAMTASRGDWCISRQRAWGVPIPVFYRKSDKAPVLTQESLAHVEALFRQHGSDAWWTLPIQELLPPSLRGEAEVYERGTDTMDVWFDSGTSWAGVLQGRKDLNFPADVYLEGSDQSRGWFQSSLLTSVATQGVAPYKTVLTHGFLLDESGQKMSKSLGNVMDPALVIDGGANEKQHPAYGADTLRMWVAGVDYSGDVRVGATIIKQSWEGYRKLRNTLRYLLGALSDFNPDRHAVQYSNLPAVDKYMLGVLGGVAGEVEQAFESYQFYKASHALVNFASVDLSAFYLDLAKDRLYISRTDAHRRRACQTVLCAVLEQLVVLCAPILPHLSEEVWQALPYQKSHLSVFQKGWVPASARHPPFETARWEKLNQVCGDVNKCIEVARQAKMVGASLECRILVHAANPEISSLLKSMEGDERLLSQSVHTNSVDDLRFLFRTSQVRVCDSQCEVLRECPDHHLAPTSTRSGVTVGVAVAKGKKCERCWYFCQSVGESADHEGLCHRCADAVGARVL